VESDCLDHPDSAPSRQGIEHPRWSGIGNRKVMPARERPALEAGIPPAGQPRPKSAGSGILMTP
jgi:hypothetical protein